VSVLEEIRVLPPASRSRRERRRLRRALRDRDRDSARLAELHRIDALLDEAARVVEHGWMQHGWFAYVDRSGERRRVTGCTPRLARTLAPEQVVSACLVGAIVTAGGGPTKVHSPLVQRTIDLAWHAAFRGAREPVRWCPSPVERAGHLIDLVRWNDDPRRSSHQVAAVLHRARAQARAETERTQDRLHSVSPLP
jgi:hypothetical protein